MRKPSDFKKSIALMQGFQLIIYSIVGAVLYSYGGQVRRRLAGARTPSQADLLFLLQYTPSPALTMTNHKLAIASYAFALVTIIVSGIVAVNVRRRRRPLVSSTFLAASLPMLTLSLSLYRSAPSSSTRSCSATRPSSRATAGRRSSTGSPSFSACTASRSSLPSSSPCVFLSLSARRPLCASLTLRHPQFFNQLLTIVSCLTSTWFVCGFAGALWLHMHRSTRGAGWFSSPVKIALFCVSVFLVRRLDLPFFLLDLPPDAATSPADRHLDVHYASGRVLVAWPPFPSSCRFLADRRPSPTRSAVKGIIDGYNGGKFNHPFSCSS